jgi:7,8-dihydroneopterin aldolase/epimerase/oxygenase
VTTIELRGIVARGRHGVAPDERLGSQEFVIDLDVDVQPGEDELSATADYREITHCARRVVDERSFALLETLADEVAGAVKELAGVQAVRVTVRKPGAARTMGIGDVAAHAER